LDKPLGYDEADLTLDARVEHDRPIRQRRRRPYDRRGRVERAPRAWSRAGLLLGETRDSSERHGYRCQQPGRIKYSHRDLLKSAKSANPRRHTSLELAKRPAARDTLRLAQVPKSLSASIF
jgi:hypothetical protein